jgi:6-phosphogluconolactonase
MKPARNRFLSTAALAALLVPLSVPVAQEINAQGEFMVFIGTYTRLQEGRGAPSKSQGIYAYRFQPATGKMTSIGLAFETVNPSFVAIHPNHRFLYSVNEVSEYEGQPAGSISAFAIDSKTGKLKLLNVVSSRGTQPCHLILDKTGKWLLVANYGSGSTAVFPVKRNGSLGEASSFVQHSGSSVNLRRQQGPHSHCIVLSPDNRFALVSDLGLDKILIYRFDAAKGTITPNDPLFGKIPAGNGPRHLAFHRNGQWLYVISEMQPAVTTFAYDPARGSLEELQTISAFPEGYQGRGSGAEIQVHPNGKFLYCSIRGLNNIGVFAIDGQKGTVAPVEHVPTQGNTPRHFTLDPTGAFLFVEHQTSDSIVMFHVEQNTGKLTPTGNKLEVPMPVCVTFLAVK